MRNSLGNTTHISQLVKQLFATNEKAKNNLQAQNIKTLWGEVVGERALGSTSRLYKKGATLFVKIESSAVKHHLLYNKSEVVTRLNALLGNDESQIKNIFWY